MNILYITVRSDFGGGPRHVAQLVELIPASINLYMAYPLGGEPYGLRWQDNTRIKGSIHISYRRFTLSTLFKLRKYVKSNHIDIIHSHGNGAGIYSRLLKVLLPSIKVVHTFHGISDIYKSKIKYALSLIVGKILAPYGDVYIAVSNGERNLSLMRQFSKADNTVVVYNGIKNSHSDYKVRPHSPLRIVTLSRFDYQKNMHSMYRIANCLKDFPVEFVWIGDGPDMKYLKNKALCDGLKINFVGFSTEPMKYLEKADIYLSTSRFEGLPYGLIEAASIGLPIVASDVKGNNEVVEDGKNGFLFSSEDKAVSILQDFVSGKLRYAQLSKNAISFFTMNFTEERMIKKLVALYEEII